MAFRRSTDEELIAANREREGEFTNPNGTTIEPEELSRRLGVQRQTLQDDLTQRLQTDENYQQPLTERTDLAPTTELRPADDYNLRYTSGVSPSRLNPREYTASATGPYVEKPQQPLTEEQVEARRNLREKSIKDMTIRRAKWEASVGMIGHDELAKIIGPQKEGETAEASAARFAQEGAVLSAEDETAKSQIMAKAAGKQAVMSARSSMSREEWQRAETDPNSTEARMLSSMERVSSALAGGNEEISADDLSRITQATDSDSRGKYQTAVSDWQERASREVEAGKSAIKASLPEILEKVEGAEGTIMDAAADVLDALPPVQKAAAMRELEVADVELAKRRMAAAEKRGEAAKERNAKAKEIADERKDKEIVRNEIADERWGRVVEHNSSDKTVLGTVLKDLKLIKSRDELDDLIEKGKVRGSPEEKILNRAFVKMQSDGRSIATYSDNGVKFSEPKVVKPKTITVGDRVLEGRQRDAVLKECPYLESALTGETGIEFPRDAEGNVLTVKGDLVTVNGLDVGDRIGEIMEESHVNIKTAYDQAMAESATDDTPVAMLHRNIGETARERGVELAEKESGKILTQRSPDADKILKEQFSNANKISDAQVEESVDLLSGLMANKKRTPSEFFTLNETDIDAEANRRLYKMSQEESSFASDAERTNALIATTSAIKREMLIRYNKQQEAELAVQGKKDVELAKIEDVKLGLEENSGFNDGTADVIPTTSGTQNVIIAADIVDMKHVLEYVRTVDTLQNAADGTAEAYTWSKVQRFVDERNGVLLVDAMSLSRLRTTKITGMTTLEVPKERATRGLSADIMKDVVDEYQSVPHEKREVTFYGVESGTIDVKPMRLLVTENNVPAFIASTGANQLQHMVLAEILGTELPKVGVPSISTRVGDVGISGKKPIAKGKKPIAKEALAGELGITHKGIKAALSKFGDNHIVRGYLNVGKSRQAVMRAIALYLEEQQSTQAQAIDIAMNRIKTETNEASNIKGVTFDRDSVSIDTTRLKSNEDMIVAFEALLDYRTAFDVSISQHAKENKGLGYFGTASDPAQSFDVSIDNAIDTLMGSAEEKMATIPASMIRAAEGLIDPYVNPNSTSGYTTAQSMALRAKAAKVYTREGVRELYYETRKDEYINEILEEALPRAFNIPFANIETNNAGRIRAISTETGVAPEKIILAAEAAAKKAAYEDSDSVILDAIKQEVRARLDKKQSSTTSAPSRLSDELENL